MVSSEFVPFGDELRITSTYVREVGGYVRSILLGLIFEGSSGDVGSPSGIVFTSRALT